MSYLAIIAGQHSAAGQKDTNDDSCGIRIPEGALLTTKGVAAVIADGMSGSEAGREAADACVQGFLNDYFSTPDSWTVATSGEKILSALNRWLYGQGQQLYGSPKGMVTTLSVLVIKSTTAYLFHVGDTRIYRLRAGELEQLTHDHRVAASGDKTYLSRAMGIDAHLDIEFRRLPVETGDIYLLTTDGVHDFIGAGTLQQLLEENAGVPEAGVAAIIRAALASRSTDNLSAQILQVAGLPDADRTEFYRKLTELPFPPPLEPGMVLDGYRVLRQIHASKRTELYLVLDTGSDTRLVMKAPSVNYDDDPAFIDQFLHEEWAGRRINSAHTLQVIEPRGYRQCLYYITEYIDGQTLREWMHDHPRAPLRDVRVIAGQIASGLRAMHRQEMIHQDLKPDNVMLDRHGLVKIIDYGSTRIAGIDEIITPLARDTILGTRNYTAPEYLKGYPGSTRSDIYSLGVICYEMLCGKLPYGEELTARQAAKAHYHCASTINDRVPDWVDAALRKAVALNPAHRYGHLSEFIHDLSHPNPAYTGNHRAPLMERNPVAFWRALALVFLLSTLAALIGG